MVLMFARLLPMTLKYVALAFRPDNPAEKDPTAMSLASVAGAVAGPGAATRTGVALTTDRAGARRGAGGRATARGGGRAGLGHHDAERGPDLIQLGGDGGELLE